jgi:hypothetical protein
MPSRKSIAAALADRDRIYDGWEPGDPELASAPLLDDYVCMSDGENVYFVGHVSGHPRVPDGPCTTSLVVAADRNTQSWIRTVSRWYRLGRPHGEVMQ